MTTTTAAGTAPLTVRYPSTLTYAGGPFGADVLECGALVFGRVAGEHTFEAYRGGERFTIVVDEIIEARYGYNHVTGVEYRAYAPAGGAARSYIGEFGTLAEAAATLAALVDTTDIDPEAPVFI